jgi:RND superfamily putative drug exporter
MVKPLIAGWIFLMGASLSIGYRFPKAVVLGWVVAAAALTAFVTPLGTVVERSSAAFLPDDSATLSGLRTMDAAFGTGRTSSYVFVVITAPNTLDAPNQQMYRRLVARLETEPQRVSEVQDYIGDKQARKALTSDDKEATYLAVGLPSAVGSPAADQSIKWLRALTVEVDPPAGTRLFVTGDPAMISDMTSAVNSASERVTVVTIGLLLLILWLVYRRWVTVFVPLATIGVALVCSRGVLALAGEHGISLSTYTDAFVIAITLGAGTDYCVFLISRFREEFASGHAPHEAVAVACQRIGPALLASAATVILGAISLSFADLAIFATTGPAMAMCVAVTVAVSLTFAPALLSWLGPRIGPATTPGPASRWTRLGDYVAWQPGRVLIIATVGLGVLAAFTPTMVLSFDERSAQPKDTPSNRGLAALAEHFPPNETLPDYVLVRADRDMRNSRDLAVLNAVSMAVEQVPGVDLVRSITQPAGEPIKPASIAYQAGSVGDGLREAEEKLRDGRPDLKKLADGTEKLDSALGKVADGAGLAADGTKKLSSGTARLSEGVGQAASGSAQAAAGAAQLQGGAGRLATGLETTHSEVARAVEALEKIVDALNGDLLCAADPICSRARAGLRQIVDAQRDQLVPGLAQAAEGARKLENGSGDLSAALNQLATGLAQAETGSRQIADGQELLASKLGELADGTDQIASRTPKLADGVDELVKQTGKLQNGLGESADYLHKVEANADTRSAGGFYLPAKTLDKDKFKRARNVFLSKDGRIARIQVSGTTDPLTHGGLVRYEEVQSTAKQALNKTPLAHAAILATGAGGLGADLKQYLFSDAKLVVSVVLLAVFLVLVLALRALVAPLYLLASVVLSCASALGLTTLVFQHILGQEIAFTVPVMVFVLLVAVGADYNILLMSRMKESGPRLTRDDVADAVTTTGPVITTAGMIFAATFVALLTSPIAALTQIGFAVAAGLMLDTLVVRSMVVPACAALLEDRNWWPRHVATPGLTAPRDIRGDRRHRQPPSSMTTGLPHGRKDDSRAVGGRRG